MLFPSPVKKDGRSAGHHVRSGRRHNTHVPVVPSNQPNAKPTWDATEERERGAATAEVEALLRKVPKRLSSEYAS